MCNSNEKILVSACLFGTNCKYNGSNNENKALIEYLKDKNIVLVCPEQLGGLPTPRPSAERLKDKVITKENNDVTAEFQKGAEETLKIAQTLNIKKAILKSKSPSCGKDYIYDGTFSKKLIKGDGITTELLKKNNISIISSDEF